MLTNATASGDLDDRYRDTDKVGSQSMELHDSGNVDEGSIYPENLRSDEVAVRSSDDSDDYVIKGKETKVNESKEQKKSNSDGLMNGNHRTIDDTDKEMKEKGALKFDGSLESDDYVTTDRTSTAMSRAQSHGFEVGDMVWGKVKSHPWWPGHIFNEAFVTSSVNRTRRPGCLLVAFFGDSSYGWFDPTELVPFDSHFAEKSQQITSRLFVKAVEEAVDEVSRRRALGLACKCRNSYNFRPTGTQGYFAVDIIDNQPQAFYSTDQINKARESFKPSETLSFMKQLALSTQRSDPNSIDVVINKATVFALRKAVFEEFDETYAQAFGVQPSRPSTVKPIPLVKEMPQASLSGPLVIAEALGHGKSSKNALKVKDNTKKDKYFLKRRDEVSGSMMVQLTKEQGSQSAPTERSSAEEYVLPKKSPPTQVKHEKIGFATVDSNCGTLGSGITAKSEADSVIDSSKIHENVSRYSDEGFQQQPKAEEEKQDGCIRARPLALQGKGLGGVKKVKVPKRSPGSSAGDIASEMKKKRKKKEESGADLNTDHPPIKKSLISKKGGPITSKKVKLQKKDVGVMKTSGFLPVVDMSKIDFEIPELLSALQTLSVYPFDAAGRNIPAATQEFFLRFRSLVYEKSLVLSPSSPESDIASKPPSAADASNMSPSLKPVKIAVRPDDPTKGDRKRPPSDRQEESTAKRLKKVTQIKSMASEKKAAQKTINVARPPAKPVKPQLVKRIEPPPAKLVEPTMLVMKFPPGTSLPSAAQLKAKFGRFGSLDQSAIRVFWKSWTCRVVFMYKADAESAFKYAERNTSLFGNVSVKYFLREVDADGTESATTTTTESLRAKESPVIDQRPSPSPSPLPFPYPQSAVGLKSCLKKSTGEDPPGKGTARVKFMLAGEVNEDKVSSKDEEQQQLRVGNRNNFNSNASFPDGGGQSSVAMDFISNNFDKVIPSQSIISPVLPQFAKTQTLDSVNMHDTEPRNTNNHYGQTGPDISGQMLSLLTKCNDVVTNVTSFLGYVPFHPL